MDLPSEQRGGLLGQGSVLTVSSYPTRTSVVLRGKYILENILGTPPPPAPPDVPQLDEASVGTSGSCGNRWRSTAPMRCARRVTPRWMFLALAWKTMTPSALAHDGREVSGGFERHAAQRQVVLQPGRDARLLVAELPNFARCLTEKFMTYSLGRGLEPFDRRTVAEIGRKLAADNYQFQTLIYAIVDSVPFQMRHAEAVPAQSSASRRRRFADDDHTQSASQKNVPAGYGIRDRIALPRCDGPGVRQASARRPSGWRLSTCRTV